MEEIQQKIDVLKENEEREKNLREFVDSKKKEIEAMGEPNRKGRPASPEAEAEGTCGRFPPELRKFIFLITR